MSVTENMAVHSTARALGVPVATLANKILKVQSDQGLTEMIPEGMARAWLALPLFVDGTTLAVALADPSDKILIADLARHTNRTIKPFAASKTEILTAAGKAY
ncbi:MAG: hypothetical protein HYZ75_16400 [Elusimicrobia bacterium]|nr:hypothetical protein [Elusimicrobiota bacterium]